MIMTDPRFTDPEVDDTDDEYGGPSDFDIEGSLDSGVHGTGDDDE